MVEDNDRLDDFHMAAISWLLLKEWDNPLWSEAARNSLLARLTVLPWWLDDQGMAIANFSIALSHPELLSHEILLLNGLLVVSLAYSHFGIEQGDKKQVYSYFAGSFLHPDGVDIQYWSENHQMGWSVDVLHINNQDM